MMKDIFKKLSVAAACVALAFVVGCADASGTGNGGGTDNGVTSAAADNTVSASETTEKFALTTADGSYTEDGGVYTLTAAGTYTLSGLLQGQILVAAGEDDDVVIELNGATIKYSVDSPIKVTSAGGVDISAKSGTENVISDLRSAKTVDNAEQGEGAIYADADLKMKGSGTLVVTANYNNGIHTTKDLKVQKLSLKVTAYNTALKGNDSVKILSGTVVAVSTHGDAVKTQNTDLNKKGVVRGDVELTGGTISVYAAGDGFSCAHNFSMSEDGEGNVPTVAIYTGSYSSYTASGAATTSYKGVKVENEINIGAGSIELHCYDDGLHANYGTVFESGGTGSGTVNITGGSVNMSVYAPANKTAGGRMGPGGWGNQQAVTGADGIHADGQLNVSGGTVNVDSAYEGLEANVINISGGKTYVSANDDGVNACKGTTTPTVYVTGGYLDVSVSPSGDTDGIDSNGNYLQTGGVVITRGPNSEMAAALDADGTVKINGGTLVILGYGSVSAGSGVKSYSVSLHSVGSHTFGVGGTSYVFTNAYAYGKTTCYSSVAVSL